MRASGSSKKKVVAKSKRAKEIQAPKLQKRTDLDTFDSWLDHQKEHELEKGTFRSYTEGKMPADTTQDWLARQSVSEEVSQRVEVAMPTSTTEAWLRKQVLDRISVEEKAELTQGPTVAAPQP